MCFSKILYEIMDLSNISSTIFESISNLSKEKSNVDAILQIANKIKDSWFGYIKTNNFANRYKKEKTKTLHSKTKYDSKNGRHLFIMWVDINDFLSIHFPKDITRLLRSKKRKGKQLYEKIQKIIEKKLNNSWSYPSWGSQRDFLVIKPSYLNNIVRQHQRIERFT